VTSLPPTDEQFTCVSPMSSRCYLARLISGLVVVMEMAEDDASKSAFEFPESSYSCRDPLTGLVGGWVVGDAGMPACPNDADPGSGEDADRVGVAFAPRPGVGVERGCPA
jgi:hypothetical protein